MQYTHQSVRDLVDAKRRGDRAAADRITADVTRRYDAGQATGDEIVELGQADVRVRFGSGE
ncbi:hypothetical protein [Streptomyces rubrogriseus]|uniref:hypothetical protein n=1 Tax=Streptomyces rubrogriseus TaxID=194673 RepID=UPI000D58D396|nr:hypothetical protein [Streptomyces rubrogriseus]